MGDSKEQSQRRVEKHYRVPLGSDSSKLRAICTTYNCALLDVLQGLWAIAFETSGTVGSGADYLVSEQDESEDDLQEIPGMDDSCPYTSQFDRTATLISFIKNLHANNNNLITNILLAGEGNALFDTNRTRTLASSKGSAEGDRRSFIPSDMIKISISDYQDVTQIVILSQLPAMVVKEMTSSFKSVLNQILTTPTCTLNELLPQTIVEAPKKVTFKVDSINTNVVAARSALSGGINTPMVAITSEAFWTAQLAKSTTAIYPPLPTPKYQPVAKSNLTQNVRLTTAPSATMIRAAWALVAAQYMDLKNVTFGVTDFEGTTGAAMMPVQVEVGEDIIVASFLEQIRFQTDSMMPYETRTKLQDIEKINKATAVACGLQTHLAIHSSRNAVTLPGAQVSLVLDCCIASTGVFIDCTFDNQVIDEAQMTRVLLQFEHVLQEISSLGALQKKVSEVVSINSHDLQELVFRNGTIPATIEKCAHHRMESVMRSQPDHPAVFAWDGEFTYAELDKLTSRLGHHLRSLGVGPEVSVPFCFEKSKWAPVAMVAIMKAGGVGVPLEPGHPIARRMGIVEDVGAKVILCSQSQLENCVGLGQLVIVSDETMRKFPDLPEPVCDDVRPNNAVYMIFTSGSTGKPKGVVWEHKTLATSIDEHGKAFYFTRRPRVLQFAAYVFDISVGDTFTTLSHGGTICIPSDHDRVNNIAGFINRAKVDWAFFTPTFARLIHPKDIPTLKTLLLGGEKVGQDNVEKWKCIQLFAVYGPAETCIYCSGNEVSIGNPRAESIGKTFGGHLWLTESGNPDKLVPIGVVGEILIEGAILAREYLGDAEKTAKAFIVDPKWSRNGSGQARRFYRTGDLGKYDTDGTIAFVGRADGQVKMRGQRMELGEVEHHLLKSEHVKHAITMVPKSGLAEGRLVAVVTLSTLHKKDATELTVISSLHRDEVAKQISEVRDYLSEQLPVYMVPTLWLPMEDIPLNTSRKLDRPMVRDFVADISQQLLDDVSQLIVEKAVDAVSTPVEKIMQAVWSRILNMPLEKIGANSSFLKLGGDSITAIQVTSRCRVEGLELTVQDILRYKTLSAISLKCKEVSTAALSVEEEIETPFELSPIQKFHQGRFPTSIENHFNQSFLLKLGKRIEADDLHEALQAVIERHTMLRARFEWSKTNQKWTQMISSDIVDSYHLTEYDEVSTIAELEPIIETVQTSFDIVNGPMVGVALVDVKNEGSFMFIAIQHIVVDLVGWRIILEDLEEVLLHGEITAPKSLPFSTWIEMQTKYGAEHVTPQKALPFDVRLADFEYWGMHDRPNLANDTVKRTFSINKDVTSLLMGQANETMTTEPNDLLLSAVIHSFAQVFNDRALPTVFNEGHGRETAHDSSIDLSRTVGWFTVMSPISIDGADRSNVAQMIREIKDARHSVSKHGFEYFTSRFLTEEGREAFKGHDNMEILFNFFGVYQQLEREDGLLNQMPAKTLPLHDFGPTLKEWALFEIEVGVEKGELQFCFAYNRHMKHQDKISAWFDQCQKSVEVVVDQLVNMEPVFTLTDLAMLKVEYTDLDKLFSATLPGCGITRRNQIVDIYPCSPMQEGILIAQTKAPEAYNVMNMFKISKGEDGAVDVKQVEMAWLSIVKRHPVLRSIFIQALSSDSLYQQVVLAEYEPRVFHIQGGSPEEAYKALKAYPAADYSDMAHVDHVFGICQVANGDAYCRLEINHTLIDLTSTQILCKEIGLAYDGMLSSAGGPLYSDYIAHVRNVDQAPSVEFWKTYLKDIQPCHFQLMNDGNVDAPVLKTLEIPYTDAPALDAFCKKHGVTMNNLISAVWALLLQTYTGEETVCFGYLTSGRELPVNDVGEIFGPMINMLIQRVDLGDSTSTASAMSIIEKVGSDYLNSTPYTTLPLAEVQHALNLGGERLFNTCISLGQKPPRNQAQGSSVSVEEIDLYDPTDMELVLNVAYTTTEFYSAITYVTSWISDANAINIVDTFAKLLTSIMEAPMQPVAQIDRLGPYNKNQMIKWNENCPGYLETTVHEAFSEQARLHPDLPALSSWDGEMDYKTLDDLSNRVAHYLVGMGVGLEKVVPLAFDKGLWVHVAQLGILKAGGACLTMDMSHPVNRLKGMCGQVSADLMLCAPDRIEKFKDVEMRKLVITEEFVRSLPVNNTVACSTVTSSNMGFVVFTSGSTGNPKGIMLEHKTVCTSSRGHQKVFEIGPGTRCLQFSAFAFDVHISDIFTPLMYGAVCCIPQDEERMNDLASAIRKLQCTNGYLTPTVATLFGPDDVPTLKKVALGGEPLTKENAHTWAGKCRIINVFGPSETSNWVTYLDVKPDTTQPANIGPGNDVNVWLVDHHTNTRLVPIGCVGEVFVEGPTVARGYYGDPQKTKEAFIENPSWLPNDGTGRVRRVYGSGDLVRFNSDGNMVYVGRKDSQVKIHGQRLELGEVEYALSGMPAVKHVSVVLPKTGLCKGHLVGVLELADMPDMPTTGAHIELVPECMKAEVQARLPDIMDKLAVKLPVWMSPRFWAIVPAMPSNASGKLDRAGIRDWVAGLDAKTIEYMTALAAEKALVMPTSPLEKKLQKMWSAVLKLPIEEIGVDSSFLRLGGDSLYVMRLVTAARVAGIQLSTAAVFGSPKLRDMATVAIEVGSEAVAELEPFELLDASLLAETRSEAASKCTIAEKRIIDMYPSTPLQEGLFALSLAQPGAFIAQNIYKLPANLNIEEFKGAWEQAYQSCEILRTRLVNSDSLGTIQVVVDDKIEWQGFGTSLKSYIENDKRTPMLPGESLSRFAIVDNHFIMTAHHVVYDGWSLNGLLEDVTAVYQKKAMTDRPAFKYFIQHLQEIDMEAAKKFWKAQLANANTSVFPQLPTPSYLPKANTAITHDVKLARKAGSEITTSTIIRAAWALVASQYMDDKDVTFGFLLSGRNAPISGIAEMMGPTITTVPVQVQIDDNKSVSDFLSQVQKQATDMMPFEQIGMQKIGRVSAEAGVACQFQCQLVVQPGSTAEETGFSTIGIKQVNDPEDDMLTYLLTLECVLTPTGMIINAMYDKSVISPPQMKRILRQFEHTMQLVNSEDATATVADVVTVNATDMGEIMEMNKHMPVEVESLVHHTFEKRVASQPNSQAILSWDGELTFDQLNRRANKLARHLVSLGVGIEVFVPFCVEKSTWTLVTVLAIMKAGGICVPLEPSHPADRKKDMIDQVGGKLGVCSALQAEGMNGLTEKLLVVDQKLMDSLASTSDANGANNNVRVQHAVYVIFTSGSTGKPKAVVWEHRNLSSSLARHGQALGFVNKYRTMSLASMVFDASVGEFMNPLIWGGTVCIPADKDKLSNLTGYLTKWKIGLTFLTPTFARLLNPDELPDLKILSLGGEAIGADNVKKWANKVKLINTYGPSECTILCSTHEFTSENQSTDTIGRAVGGVIWIANSSNINKLMPIGAVGEMLVEGPTLAREYLNNPDKTAESFVRGLKWFNGDSTRKVYRTGDLAKYNPDGTISFIGRRDNQVKLHGQRMELGEIEANLAQNKLVANVVVVIPAAGPYKGRLLAALTMTGLSTLEVTETINLLNEKHAEESIARIAQIASGLVTKLPVYMVPTDWVPIEDMPLTTTGKLDRVTIKSWLANLPKESVEKISRLTSNGNAGLDMPVTPMEKDLHEIFMRVLNLPAEEVGTNVPFIKLGGDSISAIQVSSRARTKQIDISVQDILKYKTIAELAIHAKIVKSSTISTDEALDTEFELSPVQTFHLNTIGKHGIANIQQHNFNQSFLLNLHQYITVEKLQFAVETVIKHHSMLRSKFTYNQIEKKWTQRVTNDIEDSYLISSHYVASVKDMEPIIANAQASLDIQAGLLFGASLFDIRSSASRQMLFLTAHHIIVDLVSWRIIMQDIEEVLVNGKLSSTAKSLPFQTWVGMQAEYSQTIVPAKALPFKVPTPDFAYWNMDNQENLVRDGVSASFSIDKEQTSKMLGVSNEPLNTETVDLLLAGMMYAFGQTFQDRAIPSFFNESHGREPWDSAIDLSRTVGWFTTLSPIGVSAERDDLAQIIREVKDNRRNIPNNGWQYFNSRFLTAAGAEAFAGHDQMEVVFNYSGVYQQLERTDSLMTATPADMVDLHEQTGIAEQVGLIQIGISVVDGQFQFMFNHNKNMSHQDKISAWISNCRNAVSQVIEILSSAEPEMTLSDIPLLPIGYMDLQTLSKKVLPKLDTKAWGNVEDIYPCSPMQAGILVSQSTNPDTYKTENIFKISSSNKYGPVNVDKLLGAWNKVVKRHAMLRTVFIPGMSANSAFEQIVFKERAPRTFQIQANTRAEAIQALKEYEGLDYSDNEPAHRLGLCTLKNGDVYAKLEMSHALTDASSTRNILRDLGLAYDNMLSDRNGPVYSDYISHIQRQPRDETLAYWKNYLTGVKPCHFPVPGNKLVSASLREVKDIEVVFPYAKELSAFCKAHSMTQANVAQTAWAMVLQLYTGTSTTCFGYLASGRDLEISNVSETVGPLINMLICKVELPAEGTITSILEKMQSDYVSTLPHQATSLAEVQHALGLSGERLYNSAMSVQKVSSGENVAAISSIDFEQVDGHDPSEFEIVMNVAYSEDSFGSTLNFVNSAMTEQYASYIGDTFNTIMKSIIDAPETTVANLNRLGNHNREQLMSWNSGLAATEYALVHRRIERIAAEIPDTEAICSWDGSFSYKELDMYSTRLAHHLVSLGVRPETYVPFCMEKSRFTTVAILGIMKAGGACVPIEPSHPMDRKKMMIDDVSATVMVSSTIHAFSCGELVPNVVPLSMDMLLSLPAISTVACPELKPSNAVFLYFTSGSTGKPKGVVWEHTNFYNAVSGHQVPFGLDRPGLRMLQFASHIFDASALETIGVLSNGGTICIPNDDDKMTNITRYINEMRVNWMFLTPTFARLINPEDVPGLKMLMLGGEALGADNLEKWPKYLELMNGYGPTECTIACCVNPVVPGTDSEDPNCIGHSVGSYFWVVEPDNHNNLQPIGVVGEILIEGPVLARHYLNNPEKTAEAFVNDPVWSYVNGAPQGRRFYKTGDLGKVRPDGSISFGGRKDNQVKVRGQRLELGEVEYNLSQSELIDNAVVLVPKAGPCEGKLTAALTLKEFPGATSTGGNFQILAEEHKEAVAAAIAELQELLSEALPVYMVPTVWLPVVDLPFTVSGKLDRQALTAWVKELPQEIIDKAAQFVANEKNLVMPTSTVELHMQEIWSVVLNLPVEQIGMNSSFLKLGGDSISAIQVTARCRAKQIGLTVQDILRHKTISAIAQYATFSDNKTVENEMMDTPFPLSPIQEMHIERLASGVHFNQSFLLKLNKNTSLKDLRTAMETIVEHHSMLRSKFQKDNGKWSQLIKSSIEDSYYMDVHDVVTLKQMDAIISQTQTILDLQNGPLFAAELFRVNPKKENYQLLFLTAHHMVIDLVSWRIIMQDLEEILTTGTLSAQKSLPFQSWINLQSKYAIENIKPEDALPFEIPASNYNYWGMTGKPNLSKDHIERYFTLDKAASAKILGGCNEVFNTEPVDLMLSALAYSFAQTFDREVPAFFNEGHGREAWNGSIDVSRTVGWFTTIYPIAIDMMDANDLPQCVRQFKDARVSIPNNGWSYFNSRYSTPEGSKAFNHHGDMEVVFNYTGNFQQLERNDSLLNMTSIMDLHEQSPLFQQSALFNIGASVVGGQLKFQFSYNRRMRHQDLINEWVSNTESALSEVVESLSQMTPEFTLSDFPHLSNVGYPELQKLLAVTQSQMPQGSNEIEDIMPATDYQASSLADTYSKGRGDLNYGIFDIEGPLDLALIQDSCKQLISRHPILRTVFIAFQKQLYQVILKSGMFDFFTCEDEVHTNEKPSQHILEDLDRSIGLGENHLRFMLLTHGVDHNTLVLRLPHAQFDVMSLTAIISDLKAIYAGVSKVVGPQFGDLLTYKQKSTVKAEAYWTEYLAGSTVTEFHSRSKPMYTDCGFKTLSKEIHPASIKNSGLNMAALVKGAWSVVLAQLSGNPDVVFGDLVNGRSVPVDGIESMTAPLINYLPLRVQLNSSMTVKDVLQQITDRQLASIPYEVFGTNEIVQRCTDWPSWTVFGSTINHTNVFTGPATKSTEETTWTPRQYAHGAELSHLSIETHPNGEGNLIIEVNFGDEIFPEEYVEGLLDIYTQTIMNMAADISAPIPKIPENPIASARIPFITRHGPVPMAIPTTAAVEKSMTQVVQRVWETTLAISESATLASKVSLDTPFYAIWEQAIAAAQFVHEFKQEGLSLSMEEIFEAPTMRQQIALCAVKAN